MFIIAYVTKFYHSSIMCSLKYYFILFLSIHLIEESNASEGLKSKEIQRLYNEGFRLINQDIVKADSLINIAFKESVKSGNTEDIADGYFYKAFVYDQHKELDSAITYFNKANTLYHLIDDWDNVPDSYGTLGFLLIKKNEREEGVRHLLEGVRLAGEFKNRKSLIRNTVLLANYYNNYAGQYDDALKYLDQIKESAITLGDRNLLGSIYLQMGISYYNKKDYQLAIVNSEKSFQEFASNQGSYNQVLALFTLADSYKETKEIEKALEISFQIKYLMQNNSDDLIRLNYYKLLAEIFYEKGQLEESLAMAEKAMKLLKSDTHIIDYNRVQSLLFKIHYLLGNRTVADSIYDQFNATRDSIFSLRSFFINADLREKYESEKRNQQISLQNLQLKNAKYSRQTLVGISVLTIFICIIIYGRLREKGKNEQILGLKNEKIERKYVTLQQMNEYNETLLREIHHRVKNNLQIISSLFSIQARNIQYPEVINLIEKSKSRLKTISIIHNTLYSQKSLSKIKISDFIKEIGESLFEIYNVESTLLDSLRLEIKSDNIYLNAQTSLPVGLVINELITNSLKYAFIGNEVSSSKYPLASPEINVLENEKTFHNITISVEKVSSNGFALIYTDSGPGIHDNIDVQTSQTTGLRLIRGLLQQLNGSIDYKKNTSSHYFYILFNEAD